jgi:uncharacterized protein YndB with AHSA1/START domain
MAITERTMDATPQQVFDVLLDARCYPDWVVGAKAFRDVDDAWPAVGSAFYHRVGTEVADLKDKTVVLELDDLHRIALRTFARPLGIARVVITAKAAEGGTVVSLFEEPEIGTKARAISVLLDPLLHLRNIESLRRMERVIRQKAVGSEASIGR